MRKLLICIPSRYIISISLYILCIFSGYNSGSIQDIKFKFSAFLSFVKATKCVKFKVLGAQVLKLSFSG